MPAKRFAVIAVIRDARVARRFGHRRRPPVFRADQLPPGIITILAAVTSSTRRREYATGK